MSNDWHSQLNSAWKLKKASLEPAVKETSEMGNATSSNGTNSVAANLEESDKKGTAFEPKSELDALFDAKTQLENELSETKALLDHSQKARVSDQADLAALKASLDEKSKDLKSAMEQINQLVNEHNKVTALFKSQTEDLQQVNAQFASEKNNSSRFMADLRMAEERLAQFKSLLPKLDQLSSLLSESELYAKERRSLKSQLTRATNQNIAISDELSVLQSRFDVVKAKQKASKDLLVESEKAVSALKHDIKKSQKTVLGLEKKLKASEELNASELIIRCSDTASWIIENAVAAQGSTSVFEGAKVLVSGSGPWDEAIIRRWLNLVDCKTTSKKSKNVEILVVGRDECDIALIEQMIELRWGQSIKIFTQELLFASIISGRDPFDDWLDSGDQDLFEMMLRFGDRHPVIEYLINEEFPWPDSQEIQDGTRTGEWKQVEKTPLVLKNYHVGEVGLKLGLTEKDRHRILESAYLEEIPWVESDEYMESWGQPGTRQRLARIAYHLSMLIRSRRNLPNHLAARNNWQKELEWLEKYYKPLMRFRWPA